LSKLSDLAELDLIQWITNEEKFVCVVVTCTVESGYSRWSSMKLTVRALNRSTCGQSG